jgi:hypothetical protein
MVRFTLIAVTLAALALAMPGLTAPAAAQDRAKAKPVASDMSAQSRTVVRQRPRIRVQPRYYPRRNYVTLYPLPYDEIAYPGPNAARQCVSRLIPETRPSGTVIVPRTWCRWVPR